VNELIRDEQGVERSVAHLVKVEIMLLLRIRVLRQAVDFRQRRADDIVDNAAKAAQLVNVI